MMKSYQAKNHYNVFIILVNKEEDNEEEEDGVIEKKINSFKHKITEKTARITELKESLKKTMQMYEFYN